MRLFLVTPEPSFIVACIEPGCGRRFLSTSAVAYADADGQPYVAYYCGACAVRLSKGFTVNMGSWEACV